MKKKLFNLLFLSSIGLLSAQEYSKTDTDLEFIFHKNEETSKAKIGDLLSVNMIIKSESGHEIKNTYKEGKPTLFPVKYSQHQADIYEAMKMLSKGDSATFRVSSDSLYQKIFKKPLPPQVSAGSKTLITVKCLDVNSQKQRLETLVKNNQAEIDKRKAELETQHQKELVEIEAYLKKYGYTYTKTESDLFVVHTKQGKGKSPVTNNSLTIDYQLSFINEKIIENSYSKTEKPYITLGQNQVVPGLEEGLKLMKEGGYAKIIVPSSLGYSFKGRGTTIPPYTVLMFDIGIISVR